MKLLNILFCFALVLNLSACGGRSANVVETEKWGDKYLTCEEINSEIKVAELNIKHLIPKSSKTGKNAALGVAGLFFLVPWFFMDLSNAEKQELEGYQERYKMLVKLKEETGCWS